MTAKNLSRFIKPVILLLLVVVSFNAIGQTIWYVSTSGNDNNAGTSWATAFRTIKKAADIAQQSDAIWIKSGTYYPDEGPGAINNDRAAYIANKNGVSISGGFAGTETSIVQRLTNNPPTILSGDIQQDGIATNNSRRILFCPASFSPGPVQADNIDYVNFEGSYNESTTDYNAALMSPSSVGKITLTRCNFLNNYSKLLGGAIRGTGSIYLYSCRFESNKSEQAGGAIAWGDDQVPVTGNLFAYNCIFWKNYGGMFGGALWDYNSTVLLESSLFEENQAPDLNQAYFRKSKVVLRNSFMYTPNSSFPVGLADGATFKITNCATNFKFNSDPVENQTNYQVQANYINKSIGDFRPADCSAGINRGTNIINYNLDFFGNQRDEVPDIGPYEFFSNFNPSVLYVSASATGNKDGRSWNTAFTSLQDAVKYATQCNAVQEIWVAKGTYYPDDGGDAVPNDRAQAFFGRNFLSIYGGFAGNEGNRSQRNLSLTENQSILSGEIQQDGNPGNNSYNVFRTSALDSTFLLDGFTIRDGNASENAIDIASKGGGINLISVVNPLFRNCIIRDNRSLYGSGMTCKNGNPVFVNCVFTQQKNTGGKGIIWNDNANSTFVNCSIGGNLFVANDKSVMYNTGTSSPVLYNSILTGSKQAIVGGTPQVTYSLVEGDTIIAGIGNNNGNPAFENAVLGDLIITDCSFADNAASKIFAFGNQFDIVGTPRFVDPFANDMGAYSLPGYLPVVDPIYVRASAVGANDGTSWANAFTKLGDALTAAKDCAYKREIWVAEGVYYPDEGGTAVNNDRTAYFSGRSHLSIYGGFAGTETNPGQRFLAYGHVSILSGEIQQDNDPSNNAYNLFVSNKKDSLLVLDGFTIRDANANNANVTDNLQSAGAALFIRNAPNVIIRNCTVTNNNGITAPGIYCDKSSAKFINCIVTLNTCNSNAIILNSANSSSYLHCSVAGNLVSGGDFAPFKSIGPPLPVITNSIIRGSSIAISGGTPSVSYSIIQNPTVWPGTGNLNTNPLFVNEANGNLQLTTCSPAINNGTTLAEVSTDLLGYLRDPGYVDIGAYEFRSDQINHKLYVKANAAGTGTGDSWANAFTKLNDAINRAKQCSGITEIWVSNGYYFPDEGSGLINNDRASYFGGRNFLAIYGGFTGTETQLSQRVLNWDNASVVSGNIQQDATGSNNAYNVFLLTGLDSTFLLDGFVVRDGYAGNNDGSSKSFGGGIAILGGNPVIQNCLIVQNAATNGSAVGSLVSSASLKNCVISNNQSLVSGVMYCFGGAPQIIHTTIANNSLGANELSVIASVSTSTPVIINSIIRGSNSAITGGTPSVTYSIVQGANVFPGTGNSNSDPLFVSEINSQLAITSCSPAVNKAIPIAGAPSTDFESKPRPAFGAPDMGAYELQLGLVIPANGVVFVNAAATGNGSGSSWANAVTNLQYALKFSCSNVAQIWVAKGIYHPTANNSRDSAFTMRNNLAVYGGFAGTETLLSQRNWVNNPTILSGDIGLLNNNGDNSFHVIFNNNNGLNATSEVDGFTITGGNANGNSISGNGGGIYNNAASIKISNCIITLNNASNSGGGLYNANGSNSTVTNTSILSNTSQFNAGGVMNIYSSAANFTNCTISGNSATYGAGLYNQFTSPATMINCVFVGNKASQTGGGLLNYDASNAIVSSCSFNGNSANSGGAVAVYLASSPAISNTIIYGNSSAIYKDDAASIPVVTFSLVEGGYTGIGNISSDPLFISPVSPALAPDAYTANLQLRPCSPAINLGNNASLPVGITTDLALKTRIAFGTIDMGAYERQSSAVAGIYVDVVATGTNDGSNWPNAYTDLNKAISDLNACSDPVATTIYIAKGTYTLTTNPTIMNRLNAIILGGYYPTGNIDGRNVVANPVIIKGNVQVLKSMRIDGVRVSQ